MIAADISDMSDKPVQRAGARPSLRVLVVGFPRLAAHIAELLAGPDVQARFLHRRAVLSVPFVDAVYQVGGGPIVPRRLLTACRLFGRTAVKHWVGSDVMRLHEDRVRRQIDLGFVHNFAVAPWLGEELREAGVRADVVPLSPIGDEPELPLPAAPFTVLSYLPDHKFEFYGGPAVYAAAEALPDVRFLVVGGDGVHHVAPSNVTTLGTIGDMSSIYARTHVLLRFPQHDGLSYMVLEALNSGRHVVWNHPIATGRLALTPDDVVLRVRELRDDFAAGALMVNDGGRQHVRETYGRETVRRRIIAAIRAAVAAETKGSVTT